MYNRYKVTLKETDYSYISRELVLTTIDSAATSGETIVKVPVSNGIPQTGGKKDEWCLADEYCYSLKL